MKITQVMHGLRDACRRVSASTQKATLHLTRRRPRRGPRQFARLTGMVTEHMAVCGLIHELTRKVDSHRVVRPPRTAPEGFWPIATFDLQVTGALETFGHLTMLNPR